MYTHTYIFNIWKIYLCPMRLKASTALFRKKKKTCNLQNIHAAFMLLPFFTFNRKPQRKQFVLTKNSSISCKR